jgi:dimethylamine monooxygenase subunit A
VERAGRIASSEQEIGEGLATCPASGRNLIFAELSLAGLLPQTDGVEATRWSPVPDYARLFRGDRYRFEFGIRPAEGDWFRWAEPSDPELEHRRLCLQEAPARHRPWSPPADAVLAELLTLFPESNRPKGNANLGAVGAAELAGAWEPDFVLLRRMDGEFRLVGACVCDPSWWDPAEKLGQTIETIHAPVPTLNAELGARIRTFLHRLPPRQTLVRENWGLAAVPDRNLHPAANRPRLNSESTVSNTWLRVEHQAFRTLPDSEGVAFLIWLTVHPLAEVLRVPGIAAAFRRQMETMPPDIARYKGLEVLGPKWWSGLPAG